MAITKRDFYEVLEVERTADGETITRAYRKMAMKFHPDRNGGDSSAEDRFKEAAEAYDILRDPDKRARYDRYGHAGLEGMGGGHNFNDIRSVFDVFGDLFGDLFGGGRGRGGPRGGRDLQYQLEIELVEAARGVKKSITVPRLEQCKECSATGAKRGTKPATCRRCNGQGAVVQRQGFFSVQRTCSGCGGRGVVITDPCPTCRGEARVTVKRELEVAIPAGIDTGMRIRLDGEGEAGEPGAPRGDLFVLVRVREHSLFERDGDNLVCQVPVTFSQAALGAPIDVPTLDGPRTQPLPRGVQPGDVLEIHGQGMPNVRGGRRGDLLVQIVVETPRNLTERQEELLRELAEIDKKNVSPTHKSFFDKVKEFFSPDGAPASGSDRK